MRNRLLSLTLILTVLANVSFAQMVGTAPNVEVYLQGQWLEIGCMPNAAFGTNVTAIPAGYHQHLGGAGCPSVGANLAETYDFGHDGWCVGAPVFMGDYTYPGYPFEGWELQIGTGRNQAFWPGGYTAGGTGAGLTGSMTGYNNSLGRLTSTWTGTATGLAMRQETRVDTLASWVVVTTYFWNTSAGPVSNVYYMRSCDPDNDVTWPGGGFFTNNMVNFQNDVDHRVEVTGTGASSTLPTMGLGTKDCRAVCCVYNAWPLTVTQDISALWNQTYTPASYAVGVNDPGDIGIALVYNLGTIAAGDSAVISYAYIFNGVNGIDSAFPEPGLVVDGIYAPPVGPAPAPTFDTFKACDHPGMGSVDVDIINAEDKCWTWSDWTWSPSTALSASTGTHVTISLTGLPPIITYTITGTDSASNMYSCNHRIFYLTVYPCHFATTNYPCFGDAIMLGHTGDSLAATYLWWGPGGFTSTLHNPVIAPADYTDTGMYYVVKTIGIQNDTDSVRVLIHPLPVLNLASNQVNCGPLVDTLKLGVTPDSVGETFYWTGPSGFTSTLQFPTIYPFDSTDGGTFTVQGTTVYGCKNTASISIWPGVEPDYTISYNFGCLYDTVSFVNTTFNANTYAWNFGDGSPTSILRNPPNHVYSPRGLYNVTLVVSNPHCKDSITKVIDTRHEVHAIFKPLPADTICFAGNSTLFDNTSWASIQAAAQYAPPAFAWDFGDGVLDASNFSPTHSYAAPGRYHVTLVVTDSISCIDSVSQDMYVLQFGIDMLDDTMLCVSQPFPFKNKISLDPAIYLSDYVFNWTPSTHLNDTTLQEPDFFGVGLNTYTLTVSSARFGCPMTDTFRMNSILGVKLQNVSAEATIPYGSSIQLNADSEVIYRWIPNDGSLDNPNISNPIATPTNTTLYTVYGYDLNGCLDSAFVLIHIDSTMQESIPSGFTPNGDGINDVFRPVGTRYQRMIDFSVYNRWGEKLFYTNDYKKGWDGTYNGVPQDLGTYFYVIIVARPGGDGDNIIHKGEVTLIR